MKGSPFYPGWLPMLAMIVFKILFSICFTLRIQIKLYINPFKSEMSLIFFALGLLKDLYPIKNGSQCWPIMGWRSSLLCAWRLAYKSINPFNSEMLLNVIPFGILKDIYSIQDDSQSWPTFASRSSIASALRLGCKLNHTSINISQIYRKISFLLKYKKIPMLSWMSPNAGQDVLSICFFIFCHFQQKFKVSYVQISKNKKFLA